MNRPCCIDDFMSRSLAIPLLIILAVALGGAATAASVPGSAPHVIAIVGATVVRPEREAADAALPGSTVIISGDRIQAVGPVGQIHVPSGAQVIDGRGRWVIPGLIDSHVHFFSPPISTRVRMWWI